jgi:hypothetical protein
MNNIIYIIYTFFVPKRKYKKAYESKIEQTIYKFSKKKKREINL